MIQSNLSRILSISFTIAICVVMTGTHLRAQVTEVSAEATTVAEVDPEGELESIAEADPSELEDAETPEVDPAKLESATDGRATPSFARLIRIPLPIQGNVDTRVRRMVDQVLSDLPDMVERPILVFEFAGSDNGTGDSSEFGRSLDLARFLASSKTAGVRTVAYVPQTVKGHAVLVALACEEIIMHPDAQIGAAGIQEDVIDETLRSGYREVAERRRTIPPTVALGMLDASLQVQRVTTAGGVRYALPDEVAELQTTTNVQSIDTIIPAGQLGLLSGDKLRLDYNFVSHLATDRRELAAALNVSPNDLEVDPTFGGDWNAIQFRLEGAISPMAVNQIIRGIDDALREQKVNFICLSIDSPGGSVDESIRLANYLSELDSTKVRTVAYVATEARADAAVVALACDQLAMHADAVLGGGGARELERSDMDLITLALKEIMQDKSQTWSLPAAIIDPNLEVHEYQMVGSTIVEYFCAEELQEQADPDRWEQKQQISPPDDTLQLSGSDAAKLQLANHVVGGFEEFLQQYQIEDTPEMIKPNWAHELIAALASPQVSAGLLFIAFFAMLAEVSAPGISIGGFISAVCFLLFFWSNFLAGTAGWLEALLFVAGLVFVALEIFVLPGFGIFGVGGATMILLSLVLASQTFIVPRNDYQLGQMIVSMYTVIGGVGGFVVGAVLLRKYLGDIPYFQRMMLPAQEGSVLIERQRRESVVQYDHLVGTMGRATTPLVPAGKVDFHGELVDVVSDGLAVDRGAIVEVVEVAGNRVVVREKAEGA